MNSDIIECLEQISCFLKVPVSKFTLNSDNIPTCTFDKRDITGFVNIVLTLINSNTSINMTAEENAEIRQWLEYSLTYASRYDSTQNINEILQVWKTPETVLKHELHGILATKSYFVGNTLSIADVVIFYMLQGLIEKLSHLEKERYLNVSRWYDNMQQNNLIRNNKPLVNFSTILLSVR